jgi:hypothetical protein
MDLIPTPDGGGAKDAHKPFFMKNIFFSHFWPYQIFSQK